MSYWEKTVEYTYILNLRDSKNMVLAAPLAGKEERGAGDAIFGNDAKNLILVEFKASVNEIHKDIDKIFNDFNSAKNELQKSDKHHLIIYAIDSADKKTFSLQAKTYFSSNSVDTKTSLDSGINKNDFDEYLEKLLQFKKPDGRSSSGVSVSDYDLVLGAGNGEFGVLTLSDYIKDYAPSLTPSLNQTNNLAQPASTPKM